MTRRSALKLGAAATALPLVHIRTAGAAGKLSLALWDHWVPTGDAAMKKLVDAWAEKNKVDVQLDFLASVGIKIQITMAAEAQARTGHDVYAFDQWTVQQYADSLDPVDDVMQRLIAKYGKLGHAYEYLAVVDKHWMAVPVGWGSAPLPPCGRISMLKQFCGVDVQAWFPAHPATPEASKDWTYDTQLKMAEAMFKAGYPIGFGCGQNSTDANQTWGATFGAFGADLVNAKGEITIDFRQRDGGDGILPEDGEVHAVGCGAVGRRLQQSRVDLRQGRADLESALGLGGGQARCAAGGRGLLDLPQSARTGGRLVPHRPYFWGIWKFARNKTAAKELIEYLSQREQVEQLAAPVAGYDIPPFQSMTDLSVWSDVEPPKGTIYNYPVRPWHDAEYYVHRFLRPSRDRGADLEPLSGPGHGGPTADRAVDQGVARLGQGGAGRLHRAEICRSADAGQRPLIAVIGLLPREEPA